jgi:hypothetical protein
MFASPPSEHRINMSHNMALQLTPLNQKKKEKKQFSEQSSICSLKTTRRCCTCIYVQKRLKTGGVPESRIAPRPFVPPPFNLSRLKNVYDDYPPRKRYQKSIHVRKKYNATQRGEIPRKKRYREMGYIANKKNSDGRPNPVPLPES